MQDPLELRYNNRERRFASVAGFLLRYLRSIRHSDAAVSLGQTSQFSGKFVIRRTSMCFKKFVTSFCNACFLSMRCIGQRSIYNLFLDEPSKFGCGCIWVCYAFKIELNQVICCTFSYDALGF